MPSRARRLLVLVVAAAALLVAPAGAGAITPVASVDVPRYMGVWKQLAAIPQWFDVGCYRNTTARYGMNADGTVRVSNRCDTSFGLAIPITGSARVNNPATNAELQVSFVKVGGKPQFFGGTNYVIIGLDPEYRWAVVASPERGSAFVLSRTVTQPPAVIAQIKQILTENAINTCRLRVTRQTGGATQAPPFC